MWLLIPPALADAPLHGDVLLRHYDDVPAVAAAKQAGTLDDAVRATLLDPATPIDVKAAVVAALGYGAIGHTPHAPAFAEALATRDGAPAKDVLRGKDPALPPADAFVLGYLVAMDDPTHVRDALPLLDLARKGLPNSYTVAVIDASAHARAAPEGTGCAALKEVHTIAASWPKPVDMRPLARKEIEDAVGAAWSACE